MEPSAPLATQRYDNPSAKLQPVEEGSILDPEKLAGVLENQPKRKWHKTALFGVAKKILNK